MQNNNHEWLKRCFNCMEPVDAPDAECANCGWDNHNRENGNAMLEQTILKDQYIIGKSLGRGGFGITYVGFDLTLERRVAIKEYFPIGMAYRFSDAVTVRAYTEAEEDYQSGLEQALQESRTIAKLGQIPNIMQVHNAFLENGTVYMVMEYIDGNSLAEEIKQKGRMSWKKALHLLYPIMDALEKIHEKGMIHRDFSPENIIRRRETGEPVLLDFGSARPQREGLTVMLKPGYAPMEQYSSNSEQDGRVDEYALCATMYYLVTGIAPVSADLRQFAKKELKRPSEYAEDIPVEFEEVLMKGMKPESGDRYSSVRELHEAFLKVEQQGMRKNGKRIGTEKTLQEKNEKKRTSRKTAGILTAVIVGCLVGFLLFRNASINKDAEKKTVENSVTESVEEEKEAKTEAEEIPTPEPTVALIPEPTATPTPEPTATPMPEPTATPTPEPTATPTPEPTATPTPEPTVTQTSKISENIYPEVLPRMKSDSIAYSSYDDINVVTVLESDILRKEITEVKIEKSLADAPKTAWDISEMGDGNVLAWVTEMEGEKILTIAGNGGVEAPSDSSGLFSGYINLRKVDFSGLDTSNVTNMKDMFYYCENLTIADLSTFDTSNVIDMSQMFGNCDKLKSVDVSGFDTSNVTDMSSMFDGCFALTSIDVSNFDTSNVTDMRRMFTFCDNLANIDVSNFNTSNVTNMSSMFWHCDLLQNIDVSNFDTSNVTDMTFMFSSCESLTNIDVSNFDISNVTEMFSMFSFCTNLTRIDVSNFDTSNVTDMSYMFESCENLRSIGVSHFDTSNADTTDMFHGCSNLEIM